MYQEIKQFRERIENRLRRPDIIIASTLIKTDVGFTLGGTFPAFRSCEFFVAPQGNVRDIAELNRFLEDIFLDLHLGVPIEKRDFVRDPELLFPGSIEINGRSYPGPIKLSLEPEEYLRVMGCPHQVYNERGEIKDVDYLKENAKIFCYPSEAFALEASSISISGGAPCHPAPIKIRSIRKNQKPEFGLFRKKNY